MKTKFLLLMSQLVSRLGKNLSDRRFESEQGPMSLNVEIRERLAAQLRRVMKNSGVSDIRSFVAIAFGVIIWIYQKVEAGMIIIALDPVSRRYHRLDLGKNMPNFSETFGQDIDGEEKPLEDFEGDEDEELDSITIELIRPIANEQGKSIKKALEDAVGHYAWSIERKRNGGDLERSPYL